MTIYQGCVIYGFAEQNADMILNWELVNKNDLDIYFGRSEPFYASQPYYGIKTDINPNTGYVRRGKLLKDTVDEFYKRVEEYCVKNKLTPPSPPGFACVLEGDLNYNLKMYSIEELKYDGIKSVVYVEVGHGNTQPELLDVFVRDKIANICSKMDKLDYNIKDYSNSDIEYLEQFQYIFEHEKDEDMQDDVETVNQLLASVSLDDSHCYRCYKLIFRHDKPKDAWEHMRRIISLKTITEEHDDDSYKLNGRYVYFHIVGNRAQVGNVWLNENTIMDCL